MEKIANSLFSMRSMAVAMFVFLVSIGWATILESQYDTETAKLLIYNATWFEILLVFLAVNLISNIFTYRMYRQEKFAMFMFHISFLVILIGAGITRFFSFEGQMPIQEGTETNIMYSAEPYIQFEIRDEKKQLRNRIVEKRYMSEAVDNNFSYEVNFPDRKPIQIDYVSFKRNMIDSLITDKSIKESSLEFTFEGKPFHVSSGTVEFMNALPVYYNKKDGGKGLSIQESGNKITMRSFEAPIRFLDMSKLTIEDRQNPARTDSMTQTLKMDTTVQLQKGILYTVGDAQFVYTQKLKNTTKKHVRGEKKGMGNDELTIIVNDGSVEKEVVIEGGINSYGSRQGFILNGLVYELNYCRKPIELPFSVGCKDFQLDRYPGSDSPSSFASELFINDDREDEVINRRLFMNHVIDHDGYRFFQSSYFPDESGTILSVNHDWWGTNVTYFGYLLMSIAMVMSIFAPAGRMRSLNQKLAKVKAKKSSLAVLIGVLFLTTNGMAQHNHEAQETETIHSFISEEHADLMSTLLVQDYQGRVVPYHTLCDQLLYKLSRKNTFEEYNAVQTITSMHMYFDYWAEQDVIYVSGVLRDTLGIDKSRASIEDLVDDKGNFKLADEYKIAHQKKESNRNEFDKKLIKLNEKFEVISGVFTWRFMKIIPLKGDKEQRWMEPMKQELMMQDTMPSKIAFSYFNELHVLQKTGDYTKAETLLESLKNLQRNLGADEVPSESKVNAEIAYNKMNFVVNGYKLYMFLGLLMLVVFFIRVFMKSREKTERIFKWMVRGIVGGMILTFLLHGYSIGMRWYITGHAPWSNGFEAIIFIAWVSMLAGFIFSRKNNAVLAGTSILAMLMLFVASMNMFDPEITPLVPVLKSYWLMIHVAIITGSYAFLGLACILSLLNLVLYCFRSAGNGKRVTLNINELTYVAEMTMTVGLFMLTIGTFLGGVWANESWGRYWGWDPKETWALVSVLVYAVVLHLRFIPGLQSKFTFNLASMWGYTAILFTFFGVNFYLVGLHSYAEGEGLAEIPTWLIVTFSSFVLFTAISIFRYKQYKNKPKELA